MIRKEELELKLFLHELYWVIPMLMDFLNQSVCRNYNIQLFSFNFFMKEKVGFLF